MKTPFSFSRLALGALLAALFAGCPQVPDADPLVPAPRVLSFTASASEVAPGTQVKLSWSVENAASIKIEELRLGLVSGVEGNAGEVDVAVAEDSFYVLTVRNSRGVSDTAVVSVRVTSTSQAELLFSSLPTVIDAGDEVTLGWAAPGASTVTITAAPGGAIDLGGQGATGSLVLRPQTTTTYTLSAGGRTATTTVTVRPTVLGFAASPTSADAGSTVTLSWQTANATRVQLTAPGRGTLVDETDAARVAQGSFDDMIPAQVDPGQLFSYRLLVSGAGGVQLTKDVVVTVKGNPVITSFTGPQYARIATDGGTSTLTLAWQTSEAETASIRAEAVEIYRTPEPALAATGSLVLPVPAVDTTYTLTARASRGGEVSRTVRVDVVAEPTVALTATPAQVTAGAPVVLSWTGQHIRNVAITSSVTGAVRIDSGELDTGSVTVFPNADQTYTIVVDNTFGQTATATAAVTVTGSIGLALSPAAGTLRQGQPVAVSWTVPNATPEIVGLAHDFVDTRAASTGFDDISDGGTRLTFPSTGNIVTTIDTTFRTTLFGRPVGDRITVNRYGYLTFGEPGRVNGANSVDEQLPSAKLEPFSIAPYWESLTLSAAYWRVKQVDGVQVLIVQWDSSTASFQAKVYASGRVDFEYKTLPTTVNGRAGITGERPEQSVVAPTPVVNVGVTFFGPRASPVNMPAFAGPVGGNLVLGAGQLLRVSATLTDVVTPLDFSISEAQVSSTVGVPGQWVELRNGRSTPVDLTGWTFGLADAGTVALTGSVPARGVLVVGASTDPALNDDAGVNVAVANLDFTGLTTLTLSNGGPHSSVVIVPTDGGAAFDAGIAVVNDPAAYRVSTGSAVTWCPATTAYGSQLGTPGRDTGCGFPYALSTTPFGYLDISDGGTALATDLDDDVDTVSLTAAPVPFFGTLQTAMHVSTNGFVSFQPTAAAIDDYFSGSTPSTSNTNAAVAAFARDLSANTPFFPNANVYVKRLGAGEDPFAAAPHWIVQWHHFSFYTSSTTTVDDYNFQLKFFDDGVIEVHFAEMNSRNSSQYGSGADTVSWLENPAGTQSLAINVRSARAPGISPFSAFRYTPR